MAEHDCESIRDLEREASKRKRLGHVIIGPGAKRPKKRFDCIDGPRPCPWVGCRYNLFLEVNSTGSIVYRSSADVDELKNMPYSCALDAADSGGMVLDKVGEALNISRERVRQCEDVGKAAIKRTAKAQLTEFLDAPLGAEHAQEDVTPEASSKGQHAMQNLEGMRPLEAMVWPAS